MYIHMAGAYDYGIVNPMIKIQFVHMWYTNCDSKKENSDDKLIYI